MQIPHEFNTRSGTLRCSVAYGDGSWCRHRILGLGWEPSVDGRGVIEFFERLEEMQQEAPSPGNGLASMLELPKPCSACSTLSGRKGGRRLSEGSRGLGSASQNQKGSGK